MATSIDLGGGLSPKRVRVAGKSTKEPFFGTMSYRPLQMGIDFRTEHSSAFTRSSTTLFRQLRLISNFASRLRIPPHLIPIGVLCEVNRQTSG